MKNRIPAAIVALIFNLILWVAIPSYVSSLLARSIPTLPLADLQFIFAFGAIITGLQVLGALTRGMAISIPFVSGANLAAAFYIWEAAGGGAFSLTAAGISVTLTLSTLLFLMVLPLLFNAVRAPVEFLLEDSEVGMPAHEVP